MKQLAAIALIAISLVPIAVAHEEKKRQSKYEEFVAKEGTVILRVCYDLAGPRVTHGSARSVLIHAQEVHTGEEFYAVRITHSTAGHAGGHLVAFLDRDEIDVLGKTIDRIQSDMKRIITAKKAETRLQYTTRSGFRFGFSHRPGASAEIFMTIGGRTVLLKNLADAKELVTKAQAKIQELESTEATPTVPAKAE